MKQGWEKKTLGEVAHTKGRIGWKGLTAKEYTIEGPLFISVHSLNFGDYIDFSQAFHISQARYDESPEIMLKKDDILICKDGAGIGKLGIVPELPYVSTINSSLLLIRCKKNVLTKYLYYHLLSPLFQSIVQSRLSGATTPHLYQRDIVTFSILLSKLPEQKRIVAILDKAFAVIAKAKANAEQNLKNAKELFESFLQGVFENKGEGWEEKTLKDITTILGDGLHGTPKYYTEGDYYFINGNNLSDGVIEFKENTKRVSVDEYNKYKKDLTNRTVLVSINGTLGNVAFYNDEKIILGKSACYFNLKEGVDKNFVKYVLSSPFFMQYAHKEATGATIKNVSLKTMREFKVPLPLIPEQQTIVKKLDTLSAETKKLEAIYQQKIDDLEELKKSVLQKAFNGELT